MPPRLDYRQTWDKDFRDYLKKLDKTKPVILCGDLNVAHQEIGDQDDFLTKKQMSEIHMLTYSCSFRFNQPENQHKKCRFYQRRTSKLYRALESRIHGHVSTFLS